MCVYTVLPPKDYTSGSRVVNITGLPMNMPTRHSPMISGMGVTWLFNEFNASQTCMGFQSLGNPAKKHILI